MSVLTSIYNSWALSVKCVNSCQKCALFFKVIFSLFYAVLTLRNISCVSFSFEMIYTCMHIPVYEYYLFLFSALLVRIIWEVRFYCTCFCSYIWIHISIYRRRLQFHDKNEMKLLIIVHSYNTLKPYIHTALIFLFAHTFIIHHES